MQVGTVVSPVRLGQQHHRIDDLGRQTLAPQVRSRPGRVLQDIMQPRHGFRPGITRDSGGDGLRMFDVRGDAIPSHLPRVGFGCDASGQCHPIRGRSNRWGQGSHGNEARNAPGTKASPQIRLGGCLGRDLAFGSTLAMPDPVAVNSMFSRIARRYDLANRLLSGGIDLWWRRCLVKSVGRTQPADVLDLATGSGDVAFALSRGLPTSTAIVGMDFCQPMLDEAEIKKAATSGAFANVVFRQGDGLDLPLPDASFDAVTVSFGLRNMADRGRALREMRRVLRQGGHLFVLEFSQPYRWFRPFYFFYLRHLLPWVAGLVTGDRGAYDYLCGSVESFPTHEALTQELAAAGFSAPRADRLTLGIVALHQAQVLPA